MEAAVTVSFIVSLRNGAGLARQRGAAECNHGGQMQRIGGGGVSLRYKTETPIMLKWILILLIIAAIASLLGFHGVAGMAGTAARVLIFIVLVVLALMLLFGLLAVA
jgi:uncharacterized membrane protein YtjA (UPF0391 family)